MASGTPVIATPNPGSIEVLQDGLTGCLASDADFPRTLIALLRDVSRRSQLQAEGLRRAETLDLERTIDAYSDLIRQTLDAHPNLR